MLKTLVRARLAGLFSSMFRSRRRGGQRSPLMKGLVALLVVYVVGSLLFSSGAMFQAILPALHAAGLDWLYFALAAILAFGAVFISTLFMTQSQLYEATDNELLLSMPIPPSTILQSRLILLLIMDYLIELFIIVPAAVVYWLLVPLTWQALVILILCSLVLPLLTLALGCLLGWILAMVSARVQHKSLITTVFSIAFLVLYLYLTLQLNQYLEYLVLHGTEVGEAIKRTVYPAYLVGIAITAEDWGALLILTVIGIAAMTLVYLALRANFAKIVSAKGATHTRKYRERPLKSSGVMSALIRKEMTFFFARPMYILNASLGVLFTLILPILLIAKPDFLNQLFMQAPSASRELVGPLAITTLCLLAATNIISTPSVSLEGKKLWILQASPVLGGDVLLAKAATHFLLCAPSVVIAAAALGVILKLDPLQFVLLLVTPLVMTLFQALFGVTVNLRFPKFDWINETAAIKQSLSTILTMFGGMAVVAVPAMLYLYVLSGHIYVTVYIVFVTLLWLILCTVMFLFLRTKGNRHFAALTP